MDSRSPKQRRGRPADARLRPAVLAAVGALLTEREYDRVTMEEIAARAGASKQSLYRIWGSKVEVVADAVLQGSYPLGVAEMPATPDARADIRAWLSWVADYLAEPGIRSVVRALAVASSSVPERADAFEQALVAPVTGMVVRRVAAAQLAGELSRTVSAEVIGDTLVGYLTLASIGRAPLTESRIAELVELVAPTR